MRGWKASGENLMMGTWRAMVIYIDEVDGQNNNYKNKIVAWVRHLEYKIDKGFLGTKI